MERDGVIDELAAIKNHFNSHAHVERDGITYKTLWDMKISTHTLTWSVTKQVADDLKEYSDFNSHAHVERDGNRDNYRSGYCHFNSHAHVERDT